MRGNRLLVTAALPLLIAGAGRGNAVVSEEQGGPSAASGGQTAALANDRLAPGAGPTVGDVFGDTTGPWFVLNRPQARAGLTSPPSDGAGKPGRRLGNRYTFTTAAEVFESGTDPWSLAFSSRARFGPASESPGMKITFSDGDVSRYAFNNVLGVLGGQTGRWGAPLFPEALEWRRPPAARGYARSSRVGLYGGGRYRPAETMDIVNAETSLWPTATSSVPRALTATISGGPGLVVGGRSVTVGTSVDAAKAHDALRRLRSNGRRSNGAPRSGGTAVAG